MPVFWIRQRTGLVLSEDAIPVPRDQVVAPVAHSPWEQREQHRAKLPTSAKLPQDLNGCVVSRKQSLTGLLVIEHQIKRVEIIGIGIVLPQKVAGKIALQRCEPKPVSMIVLEHKLDQAVAESANAIVEDDRIGRITRQCAPADTLPAPAVL